MFVSCRIFLLLFGFTVVQSQAVDDFTCPDEFRGFYPHLISCDKYWYCQDGVKELKTCGNGLGFLDNDETFTLEQCAELHLVECGARTELEPAVSTTNCPRLFGTFADAQSCSIFYKCIDGKANRYECPPGLAFDQVERGCKWADEVPECKAVNIQIDGENEEFKCPRSAVGAFTKHAHPADCRQYFVCIAGVPREYGCPLGTVFDGKDEISGKCTDPAEVPDCKNYYGELEFDDNELKRAGFDTGKTRQEGSFNSGRQEVTREVNNVSRTSIRKDISRPNQIKSKEITRRPAPPSLQSIIDEPAKTTTDSSVPAEIISRIRPRPSQFQPSNRESLKEIKTLSSPPKRPNSNRLQVITDRNIILRPEATTTSTTRPVPTTTEPSFQSSDVLNNSFSPNSNPTLIQSAEKNILPEPVKAAPGPDGEEYYYYYYYYDDDEKIDNLEEEQT